jgi:hypothetical protein
MISQPIKDKSTHWGVRVWVDGRYIAGHMLETASSEPVLESTCYEKQNREIAKLKRTVKRLRSSKAQEPAQVVDLTGDDSD